MSTRTTSGLTILLAAVLAFGTSYADGASAQSPTAANALAPANAPSMGPVTAPVTIVEFFDPACESCRAMYPHVKQLLAANPKDVRLVIRYVPFHGAVSKQAINVLEAARQQKRLVPVMDALMQHQPVWASHRGSDPEKVWDFAVQAGLDRKLAQQYIATGAVETLMKREVAAVEAAKIQGTPTFYVNGKQLAELGPEQLEALVNAELSRARKK
ncbi:protein-disulfide isomerase [Pseudoxanthomonas japonensis]|uniref:DsbA family protein n=1 Tax=Pseudoxanthomonas japonensis TaxID=69284 RepID=UPI002858CA73|nr:thioredoxin domain-containing protein [Pseudoxanthomonas japonensis]MDR7070354.1 protein-disulfide isomerase [Pseudoxanthomonas japonensis]